MSPEQAAGAPVSLATDTYALGAILCEILVGQPPFADRPGHEVVEQLCSGAVPELPRVGIPRPLAAICKKAMAPRPQDRYPSAAELAEEVQRWLADEPVRAHIEPLSVRAGRWARKHRTLVTAAAAVLIVTAMGAVAASLLLTAKNAQLETAYDAERTARAQAEANERLAIRSRDRRRAVLDDATSDVLELFLAKQAHELDEAQRQFLSRMLAHYEDFAREEGQDDSTRLAAALARVRVARIRSKLGDHASALATYEMAKDVLAEQLAERPDDPAILDALATVHNDLGVELNALNRHDLALTEFENAIQILQRDERLAAPIPQATTRLSNSLANVATTLRTQGKFAAAEEAYQRAITYLRAGPESPGDDAVANTLAMHLASYAELLSRSRPRDCNPLLAEAIDLRRRLAVARPHDPEQKQDLARCLLLMSGLAGFSGSNDDAATYVKEAREIAANLVADYPAIPAYREMLGSCYLSLGRLRGEGGEGLKDVADSTQQAAFIYRRLVEDYPKNSQYRHNLAISLREHAYLLTRLGKDELAEQDCREAIEQLEECLRLLPSQESKVGLASCAIQLGETCVARKASTEAVHWFSRALQELESIPPEKAIVNARFYSLWAYHRRGTELAKLGRHREAIADFDKGAIFKGQMRDSILASRAYSLVQVGELADGLRGAHELVRLDHLSATSCYVLAAVFALAADRLPDATPWISLKHVAHRYRDQAVDLLRRARDANYFTERTRIDSWLNDPDFRGLRGHPEYARFASELEKLRPSK